MVYEGAATFFDILFFQVGGKPNDFLLFQAGRSGRDFLRRVLRM